MYLAAISDRTGLTSVEEAKLSLSDRIDDLFYSSLGRLVQVYIDDMKGKPEKLKGTGARCEGNHHCTGYELACAVNPAFARGMHFLGQDLGSFRCDVGSTEST
jgi:hypothetical protein